MKDESVPPIDVLQESCPVCGSPHIDYVTEWETGEEDLEYRECLSCGWRFE